MMYQRGFTYLVALFAVAIIGAVLGATSVIWHTQVQRDNEQELLFIGHAYRRAIAQYYENTPGTAKQFPKKLEDLLEDSRQTRLTRYLRKAYRDPMSGSKEWGLLKGPDASIVGVYSLSSRIPIKRAGFEEEDREFVSAANYSDWKFVYTQPTQPTPSAAPPNPNSTGAPGQSIPAPVPANSTPSPLPGVSKIP